MRGRDQAGGRAVGVYQQRDFGAYPVGIAGDFGQSRTGVSICA